MLIIVEDKFGNPLSGATIIFQQGGEILATVESNVGRATLELPDPEQAVKVKVTYGDVVSEANIAAGQTSHTFKLNVETVPSEKVPEWFAKAGFASLILIMMFLMVIVFFSSKIQDDNFARVSFSALLGFSCAAAALFFGGSAAADGRLPLPGGVSPLNFSLTSGVAVFVVVTVLSLNLLGTQDENGVTSEAKVLNQCVYFQKGAADFLRLNDKYSAQQIDYINSILLRGFKIGVTVVPETSSPVALAKVLSEQRNSNIRSYLLSKGIPSGKIVILGQGESPISLTPEAQLFMDQTVPSEVTNMADGANCTALLLPSV